MTRSPSSKSSDWKVQRCFLGLSSEYDSSQGSVGDSEEFGAFEKLHNETTVPAFDFERAEERWRDAELAVQEKQASARASVKLEFVWRRWVASFWPYAAVCVALLLCIPFGYRWFQQAPHNLIIFKGSSQPSGGRWRMFGLLQQGKEEPRLLKNFEEIKPNMKVRFELTLKKAMCVLIVSIEESGKISLYWPYPSTKSVCLPAGTHQLPKSHAIVLDDALGWERFIFVSLPRSFELRSLRTDLKHRYVKASRNLRNFRIKKSPWHESHLLLRKVR